MVGIAKGTYNASSSQVFKNKLKEWKPTSSIVGFVRHMFYTSALYKLALYENSFWNAMRK